LVPPGDPFRLAQSILDGLSSKTVLTPPARTWADAANELNSLYLRLVDRTTADVRQNAAQ
jgi:hypothetical protein